MLVLYAAPPHTGLIGNLFQGEVEEKDKKREMWFLDDVLTETGDDMHHCHTTE
jgi:hypothetical protein